MADNAKSPVGNLLTGLGLPGSPLSRTLLNPPVSSSICGKNQTSKVYRFDYSPQHSLERHHISFWAQNGMVHLEDSKTGTLKALRPGKFMKHAIQVFIMQRQWEWDVTERIRAKRLVDEAAECAKAAKAQGDPFDAKVQAHRRKHKPRVRVSTIVGPGGLPLQLPVKDLDPATY